jgi:copper chaperone CopZ
MKCRSNHYRLICLLTIFILFPEPAAARQIMKTTFDVANLSCGSCLSRIYATIGKLDGFVAMEGDIQGRRVSVLHRESLDNLKIADAITAIGYPAEVAESMEVDGLDLDSERGSGRLSGSGGCCGGQGANFNGGRFCGATLSSWKQLINYCRGIARAKNDIQGSSPKQ